MEILGEGDRHAEAANTYEGADIIISPGDLGFDRELRGAYVASERPLWETINTYGRHAAKMLQVAHDPRMDEEARETLVERHDELVSDLETRDRGKVLKEGIDQVQRVLGEYDAADAPAYVVPGNWDIDPLYDEETDFFDRFVGQYDAVHNVDGRLVDVETDDGTYQVAGLGAYQFDTGPDSLAEWDDPTVYTEQRQKLAGVLDDADAPVLLVTHNPPFDSGCDRIDNQASSRHGLVYGSDAVSEELREREETGDNPVVAVFSGHIHEGRGIGSVAGVPVFNLGQNQVTLVTVSDGVVSDYSFG